MPRQARESVLSMGFLGPSGPRPESLGFVDLRSNENPFAGRYRRYPEHSPDFLAPLYLAALEVLDPPPPRAEGGGGRHLQADVAITRGATEALDLLLRALFEPGRDAVAVTWPSFGSFEQFAALHGVTRHRLPLGGVRYDRLDVDRLLSLPVKGIYLCNPNNPTSTCLDPDDLALLLDRFDGIVIVDETYAEFTGRPSLAHRLGSHPGLVSVRSMSKALGMAGLRLGAVLGAPDLVGAVRRVRPPFPVPGPVAEAAAAELADHAQLVSRVASCVAERDRLAKELADCPGVRDVFADAGFVTVRLADQDAVLAELDTSRIAVHAEPEGWRGFLRISVGTPQENALLLSAVRRSDRRSHL
ncbi:pyridoxal phosphate-dependent aminotransferase [Streptomyces sp. NPDC101206]|uniref:pyridoxal phosphate-dependent aminotransferase n=1 Tax=Streptomyces sp. NPDC101206 TaxID=3366128 RepID=UPI0037FBE96D